MRTLLIIILIIFLIACTPIEKECNSDNNCSIGGCSGQICGEKEKIKDIITTCEYKEQYQCYKLTNCSCINEKCQWKSTKEFNDCLTKFS